MKLLEWIPAVLVACIATCGISAAQDRNPFTAVKTPTGLKLIKYPVVPCPKEALMKHIEGTVAMSLVVDAKGNVTDAVALSGPPELFDAALESVKQWKFEKPANAPVTTTAEIAYGHPHECPGPVSTISVVSVSEPLKNERGLSVGFDDRVGRVIPPYFTKERLAGISGEMILAVTVNAKGRVTNAHVVKSLSPRLDHAAVKTVRKWRFFLREGDSVFLPDVFPLRLEYKAMCEMQL